MNQLKEITSETNLQVSESMVTESMVTETLDNVSPGDSVEVCQLDKCDECLCRKLSAMGIVSGCIVKVLGRSPFGDPISISALGYKLSLRLSEARNVVTKKETTK